MYKNEFNSSWMSSFNSSYIDNLYNKFLLDPTSIDNSWYIVFTELSKENYINSTNKYLNNKFQDSKDTIKLTIELLINIFRTLGYKFAHLNPLDTFKNDNSLSLKKFLKSSEAFRIQDSYLVKLSQYVLDDITTKNVYDDYKNIYCKRIGYQFMHIHNSNEMNWIKNYIETKHSNILKKKKKIQILKHLIISEMLEKYFSSKFPSIKRFSIEGAESLIPMLKEVIKYTKKFNLHKIIFGMSHRGRLNVLANILDKPIKTIFNEFCENNSNNFNSGDVKYHMGFCCTKTIGLRKIILDLKSNPSHLEVINPVVVGSSRAYIDSNDNLNDENILPIIIHGDAAISGQGVVQELLNMSQARGYKVGGTIHIVVNNQIGFTTSKVKDLRTSQYCTDIAKMIDSPIFHVNADDPESVIFVTHLALNYRFCFKKDVFINLVCYRRHGHNEIDDPSITQPVLYSKIKNHPTTATSYYNKLLLKNIINKSFLITYQKKIKKKLDVEYNLHNKKMSEKRLKCCSIVKADYINVSNTPINNISQSDLTILAKKIFSIPNNIEVHNRVFKIYKDRLKMANNEKLFDWGASELLAYASLLNEGISCRLSGEDVCRGTFFHRHAVIHDQKNDSKYIPLKNIKLKQGNFYIWDSVLSEEATLAFEYGYSIDQKNTLNVWEAQFGDFANGAQIIIDQFICSGEQKWNVTCNLVMLLPHGYEGQGPEHSSARIERYLQLSANNNIKIIIPTISSQIYHIIRKQAFSLIKKPLIIMSPKSLLRFPLAASSLSELSNGKFRTVIDEIDNLDTKKVQRIILCSGKIYYDLLTQRRINQQKNIVILRIEQIYPRPTKKLSAILYNYKDVHDYIWCQEEPCNQGAWLYHKSYLKKLLPKHSKLNYVGRSSSASPATGYMKIHKEQQKKIIYDALNISD
ncbi:oxoglutarate dehydrogenase [Buchnera aphidicola str. Bp (Baizongia pistaciae)]|uniref:Oxoglutarate dehydrogenase n=1 Tax=Buchnera aphidicola subsp. Baizongia pistaciae (strain Bp) TaxID=224915 RepID=ODO1_BUCBP|nr:2-oxoglutarate dehydrogenase E1 component [Buchnera aphidicola]Q89AJ7.1 RecName: Full=Oxoglutarate dehydrogenase [Buchnera aphidicola str. Bp (Baizongia pistaciae)]AAO27005.1 oxoglutarate dehydrogenase [Buchnera aphidicola str. Bp (Baizongia pistaciae)]